MGDGWCAVVVDDGAGGGAVGGADGCAGGWAGQAHRKGFIAFKDIVLRGLHREGLAGFAGGERQRAGGCGEVGGAGGIGAADAGGEVHALSGLGIAGAGDRKGHQAALGD